MCQLLADERWLEDTVASGITSKTDTRWRQNLRFKNERDRQHKGSMKQDYYAKQ